MKKYLFNLSSLFLFTFFAGQQLAFAQPANHVTISQIYGGGGNLTALYLNDFIELFNPTSSTVNLAGMTVQYQSATGTTWNIDTLSGSIGSGQYFLVEEQSGGTVGSPLPTPDLSNSKLNLSATNGKVFLVNSLALLTSCTDPNIVDMVGYGTANCFEGSVAPAMNNDTCLFRVDNGCTDSDDNSADFFVGDPNPRNSSNSHNCLSGTPLLAGKNFSLNVYPNPSSGVITIKGFQADAKNTSIEVYNVAGTQVYTNALAPKATETTIDLSTYSNGIYWVVVRNNGKVFREKVEKR